MTLALAPHVCATVTEDGMVLLDERTGRYWQLNGTGAAVLRHLLDGSTVDAAAARLRERHPDAADRIAADVAGLLDSLHAAKLVTP